MSTTTVFTWPRASTEREFVSEKSSRLSQYWWGGGSCPAVVVPANNETKAVIRNHRWKESIAQHNLCASILYSRPKRNQSSTTPLTAGSSHLFFMLTSWIIKGVSVADGLLCLVRREIKTLQANTHMQHPLPGFLISSPASHHQHYHTTTHTHKHRLLY